ncbi:lysophospholipid acyltransferase family protein [uncultured Desulfobacter sp.]|uniref:lysophospholipid acyltransferase family protein n=1 Tax=uncultured Desulfobacter sp. TaxID=240139 RepID=UPI002AAAF8BE|nr:lysophospholipid acyltransferase family protein [uncultured Desulfobacter sp.]
MNDDRIYLLLRLLVMALGRLPIGVADFCARYLGLLWFKIDARHRKITLENITRAFGDEMTPDQIEILGKRVFKNIISILFELAWSLKFDRDTFLSHFTIKGVEHMKQAHAKGKGVIGLLCHLGNFEMLIAGIEPVGVKGYAIYRKLDFQPLDRLIREGRKRFSLEVIPRGKSFKTAQTILERGEIVGSLLDQSVDWYLGPFVDFFGVPACTHKGFAKLVLETKAPVVPAYTVRKNRHFTVEFLPEIPLVETGDPIKDIEINTQNYTSAIESMIRKYPDQYFWVHNRWKTKNYCPWPKTND